MRAEPILAIIGIILLVVSTILSVAIDIAREAHKDDNGQRTTDNGMRLINHDS